MTSRSLQIIARKQACDGTTVLPNAWKQRIIARVESDQGAKIGRLAREFGVGYDAILQVVLEHAEEKARRHYSMGYRDGRNTWLPPGMARRAA